MEKLKSLENLEKLAEVGLSRRRFTAASVMALLAGVTVTISGCGGGSSYGGSNASAGGPAGADGYGPQGNGGGNQPSPSPTPGSSTDKVGTISNNHGHSAVITGAQVSAGGAITLNIQGQATHNHTVPISASDLATIASGGRVSHDSSTTEGHNHTVTFN